MGSQHDVSAPVKNGGFDPRKSQELMKRRYAHDVVTAVCLFTLLPTVIIVFVVYMTMLCKHYLYSRNTKRLLAIAMKNILNEIPQRLADLAGIPAMLGAVLCVYYIIIFYFNSDVPGIKPALPQISMSGVRADSNYSFALLMAAICVMVFSIPDILAMHALRIYE